ncbi:MAG: hypothetical protein ACLU80_04835 [Dorea sp.]
MQYILLSNDLKDLDHCEEENPVGGSDQTSGPYVYGNIIDDCGLIED